MNLTDNLWLASNNFVVSSPSVDTDDHQVKSQDTNDYASVEDRGSAILMKDNSAYMCSSTHSQDSISTDYNIAYYSSNRVQHEDDHDNVYEYIQYTVYTHNIM